MIGVMLLIFLLLPETPWWLASKGKLDKAEKTLLRYNGHVSDYNAKEHVVRLPSLLLSQRTSLTFSAKTERHGSNHSRRTLDSRTQFRRRYMGYFPRQKPHPFLHCWMAEDRAAVCGIECFQHIRYVLL